MTDVLAKDLGALREQPPAAELEGLRKLSGMKDLEIAKLTRLLTEAQEKQDSLKAELASCAAEIKEINVLNKSSASALRDRDIELRKINELVESVKQEIAARNAEILGLTKKQGGEKAAPFGRKLLFWKKRPGNG